MSLRGLIPQGWPGWVVVLAVAVDLALVVVAITVVSTNRRPSSAIAWVLAIFFVPVLGLLAFALIGSRKLPKRRRERQRYVDDTIRASTVDDVNRLHVADPRLASLTRLNQALGALPVVGDTSVSLVEEGRGIEVMAQAVAGAERFVHVEFYLVALDSSTEPLFAAMEDAVARGVVVRVLFDHLASLRSPGYRRMRARLRSAGVHARPMLPVWPTTREWLRPDLRNHRKILVVDGLVAFTGSLNVVDPSYNKRSNIRRGLRWVDLLARVEGPAVTELAVVFLTDWLSETGEALPDEVGDAVPVPRGASRPLQAQVVPSGPGFPARNNLKLFTGLVHASREELAIVSPYFVPEEALLLAITSAAQRGVAVDLFVSEIGDQWLVHHAQRSYYDELLRAGVRIWLYPAPYVLHTKSVRIDGHAAAFGSSNMDIRSFELDLEVTLLVIGEEFAEDLRAVEEAYRLRSRELTIEGWQQWSRPVRTMDNLARLASAVV